MSQSFIARRNPQKPSSNSDIVRQSIIELRGVYANLSDTEYCIFYEHRYGIKFKDVKKVLESVENEPTV